VFQLKFPLTTPATNWEKTAFLEFGLLFTGFPKEAPCRPVNDIDEEHRRNTDQDSHNDGEQETGEKGISQTNRGSRLVIVVA
jgi:hypothetical protein